MSLHKLSPKNIVSSSSSSSSSSSGAETSQRCAATGRLGGFSRLSFHSVSIGEIWPILSRRLCMRFWWAALSGLRARFTRSLATYSFSNLMALCSSLLSSAISPSSTLSYPRTVSMYDSTDRTRLLSWLTRTSLSAFIAISRANCFFLCVACFSAAACMAAGSSRQMPPFSRSRISTTLFLWRSASSKGVPPKESMGLMLHGSSPGYCGRL
mmetsp:Transcript_2537/g.6298  ORF Transcript_2537/g.6298 Transcript_2537/m.6298 type:complete len:211 (+) Transcript_2537:91-723(+)